MHALSHITMGRIKHIPGQLHWRGQLEGHAWILRSLSPQASLPFAEFNLFSFSVITMCVTAFLSPVSPFSQIVKPEGGLGDPNTTRRCMILFI